MEFSEWHQQGLGLRARHTSSVDSTISEGNGGEVLMETYFEASESRHPIFLLMFDHCQGHVESSLNFGFGL